MPQFDQGSFLNQVFWFFLIFINSYFLLTYYFLPIICENLKFRKKKIIKNKSNNSEIILENLQQNNFLNESFKNIFGNLYYSINSVSSKTLNPVKGLKENIFKKVKLKNDLKNFYVCLLSYNKIVKNI